MFSVISSATAFGSKLLKTSSGTSWNLTFCAAYLCDRVNDLTWCNSIAHNMLIHAIDSSWVLKQDPSDIFASVGCHVEQSDPSRVLISWPHRCGYAVLAYFDHSFDILHLETWHEISGNRVTFHRLDVNLDSGFAVEMLHALRHSVS